MVSFCHRNYWENLNSTDIDFSNALQSLDRIISRRRVGRGSVLARWKVNKSADKTWYPPTYWCHECDVGTFGRGISSFNGPLCERCYAPVEERCDMRNRNAYCPEGSEFWTPDRWQEYEDYLEEYYDRITPDCE